MPDLSFYSEAPDIGWGAIMGEQQVSRVWTPNRKQGSITLMEIMAVYIGLLVLQPAPQRRDDRPVLRQCHNSRVSQATGRHKVRGPVPQSKGDPPVGRIYADHDPTPVHPGFSQYESGSPQSAQSGDRVRVDTIPTGGPGSPSPVAGYRRPFSSLADGKTPSVLCPSVGTQGNGGRCIPQTLGQPPGVCLHSNSHHKESSSQTESLSPLRSHPDRPLLASKGKGFQIFWNFYQTLQ